MISVIYRSNEQEHPAGAINLPIPRNQIYLQNIYLEYIQKFFIEQVYTDTPWLNSFLNELVSQKSYCNYHILMELELLAFLLERMTETQTEQLKGNLPEDGTMEELLNRAIYYAKWTEQQGMPMEAFHQYSLGDVDWLLVQEENKRFPVRFMTGEELFSQIFDTAITESSLQSMKPMIHHLGPHKNTRDIITCYKFHLIPELTIDSYEGIFISCYLHGKFDESGREWLPIGTLMTYLTDLEACENMGNLCGALLYHGHDFVDAHLDLLNSPNVPKENEKKNGMEALCKSLELTDVLNMCVTKAVKSAKENQETSVSISFESVLQALRRELLADDSSVLMKLWNRIWQCYDIIRVEIQPDSFLLTLRSDTEKKKGAE